MDFDIFLTNFERLIIKARLREKIISVKSKLNIESKPIYFDPETSELEYDSEFDLTIEYLTNSDDLS